MVNGSQILRWLSLPIFVYAGACFAFDDGFHSLSSPCYLPNGKHIIFSYTLHNNSDIFGYDLNSRKLQQLTHAAPEEANVNPAPSPDGSRVAFVLLNQKVDEAGRIMLMNSDGSSQRLLTDPPAGSSDFFPVWSNDGTTLYFARAALYRPTSTFGYTWDEYDLYSIAITEGKEKRITEKKYYELTPVSSLPRNDSILLHITDIDKDTKGSLVVFNPKDGSFHSFDHQGLAQPTFTSSGNILFVEQSNPGTKGAYDYDLFMMKSDGSTKRQITRNHSYNTSPCISPDGKNIIFLSDPERNRTTHLMQVGFDGSDLHEISIFSESEPEKLFSELLDAAEGGDIQKIQLLLGKGAEVNERNREGVTPLIAALSEDHLEAARILLKSGADPNGRDDDFVMPLVAAITSDHPDAVRLLLEFHPNLEAKDGTGFTPLAWAALSDNTEIINIILKAGANPNTRTENGATALMLAATHGELGSVRTLLEGGANPSLRDKEGHTALDYAYGYPDVVSLLKAAGVKQR